MDVLTNYIEERPRVPFEDLRYVFGEIMYGGHITDVWDRRLCLTYLERFIRAEALDDVELVPGVAFPLTRSFAETLLSIQNNFPDESPSLFLLNPITESRARRSECNAMFAHLQTVMPRALSKDDEEKGKKLEAVAMLLGAVPDTISLADIQERLEEECTPFQHVFLQECERMNVLSYHMRSTLDEAEAALKGTVTTTPEVEALLGSIDADTIPATWLARWGASLRPLASWSSLISASALQLSTWALELTNPKVVNLTSFFIPVAFLTAILQDTAVRTGGELDQMGLITEVTKRALPEFVDMPARDGCFVFGPSLEGAGWDATQNSLVEGHVTDGLSMPVLALRASPQFQDRPHGHVRVPHVQPPANETRPTLQRSTCTQSHLRACGHFAVPP